MATDKIRFTGMNSGIDTEAVISALVSSKKTKVDDAKKAQIKLEWKQEVWKDLNSKIYGLYSGKLTSMKFSTAYNKKVTSFVVIILPSPVLGLAKHYNDQHRRFMKRAIQLMRQLV